MVIKAFQIGNPLILVIDIDFKHTNLYFGGVYIYLLRYLLVPSIIGRNRLGVVAHACNPNTLRG